MSILLVAAGILVNAKNEVLLAQRPEGKRLTGKWEYPGGKIEAGESPEVALSRELKEELDIDTDIKDLEPFYFLSHDYTKEFGFHLLMPSFICRTWQGTPRAVEHQALAWKSTSTINELEQIRANDFLTQKIIETL